MQYLNQVSALCTCSTRPDFTQSSSSFAPKILDEDLQSLEFIAFLINLGSLDTVGSYPSMTPTLSFIFYYFL